MRVAVEVEASALEHDDYLNAEIEGETFELDAAKAKCFIKSKKETEKVPCSKIAPLVANSADAVNAIVLPKRQLAEGEGEEKVEGGGMSFDAKKIVVTV